MTLLALGINIFNFRDSIFVILLRKK